MRRLSLVSPVLTICVLACGAEAPPAATPKVEPAAKPAEAPAKAPELALHDRGRVFLVGGEAGYVPLACSDRGSTPPARFAAGEACLALLPTSVSVRAEDGTTLKVTGTAKDPCGATAVTVEGTPDAWRGHATAPPVDNEWVDVVPPTTPEEDDRIAPDELRAGLAAQVEQDHAGVKAGKKLQVRQRVSIDITGDGAPEQVVAVAVPGPKDADGDETLAFAGLYVVGPDDAPPRKLAGAAPGTVQYRVLGAFDLDKDGKPELWLNSYDADRFTQSVEQVDEAGLTRLGSWVCET